MQAAFVIDFCMFGFAFSSVPWVSRTHLRACGFPWRKGGVPGDDQSLLAFLTNSELIVTANRLVTLEVDFDDLFTLQLGGGFIVKRVDDLSGLAVDDVAAGRDHILPVDGHEHPARHVGSLDVGNLFRWHDGIVEDMDVIVGSIREPDLFFVRRQGNAVTGTSMPLDGARLKPLHRYFGEFFACLDVANLKSQKTVDIHIATGVASIDCKGA